MPVTWLIAGGLMLLCGFAMARLMCTDGRPSLRQPPDTDRDESEPHD